MNFKDQTINITSYDKILEYADRLYKIILKNKFIFLLTRFFLIRNQAKALVLKDS